MISQSGVKKLLLSSSWMLICLLGLLFLSCDNKPTPPVADRRWMPSNTGLENLYIEFLAVHPLNPSVVFAGTFDGLYRSANGGRSWARVDSGWAYSQISSIAFDPLQATVIYTGTKGSGVFKSTDGGGRWERHNTGLGDKTIFSLATHSSHSDTAFTGCDGGIYRTYDGADSTWTKVHWFNRAFVAVNPQNPQKIYAGGQYNNFFKSTDGGNSWTASAQGMPTGGPEARIQWVLIDPGNADIIYTASNNVGIYKSTDDAGQWIEANTSLGTKVVRALGMDPSDSQHLYAATNEGVSQSFDGAASWEAMNTGLTTQDIKALAAHPTDTEVLYAGTWGGGVFIWTVP